MKNSFRSFKQSEKLQNLFLDTLNFKLFQCGVSQKDLPYEESWSFRPNGFISQSLESSVHIDFRGRPSIDLSPRMAIIIPPNMWHRAVSRLTPTQNRTVYRWAHFQFFVAHSLDVFSFFDLPHAVNIKDAEQFGNFNETMTRISENKTLSVLETAAGIKKTAFEILDLMLKTVPLKGDFLDFNDEIHKIEPTLNYLKDHFNQKITVAELAKRSGMSQTRFFIAFKNVTGMAPVEYLIQTRLKESQRMLWLTQDSITEIALQCGYEDPFFFSKIFKKYTGTTPRQYRQQLRNTEQN